MLKQAEIESLTTYLGKLFNSKELVVLLHPEDDNQGLVAIGQEFFARIERDEDEGELMNFNNFFVGCFIACHGCFHPV